MPESYGVSRRRATQLRCYRANFVFVQKAGFAAKAGGQPLATPQPSSIFSGDRHLKTVERIAERDLAGQTRKFIAVIRAVEQIVFVFGHRGQLVGKGRVNVDMAGGAAAATAAQSQQFIIAIVANHFHDRAARSRIHSLFFTSLIDHYQLRHRPNPYACPYRHLERAANRSHAILQPDNRAPARKATRKGNRKGRRMGLDTTALHQGLDTLAASEPAIAQALAKVGYPEPRLRETGHVTLLRTIVGQQVSVAAAASVWNRLEALIGPDMAPDLVLEADFDTLRGCGLSRQKQGYVRSLCELMLSGDLNLHQLANDDEVAIAQLTRIKGIGRWSAEIYLLFAEGRPDIWPAGDLGVQAGLHRLFDLPERPSEKATRAMSEAWRPHRGALAIFTWHCHNNPALQR